MTAYDFDVIVIGGGAPGEAVTGPVDARAALAWRDFMVSDHTDAGGEAWAESAGITVLRGRGRLAGPHTVVVGGDDTRTAEHVVIATGADPVVPPVPGLRELPGTWTNREATAVTEIPERLPAPRPGSGSSRPPSPSAPACRCRCCSTSSSRSRRSPRRSCSPCATRRPDHP